MNVNKINFPPELVSKIVRCVEEATGNDIRIDIQKNNLQTRNSVPARVWDLLNTNLINELDIDECTIAKTKRGPWEMLVIFEKTTQCVFTFMREKRFEELKKQQCKRRNMHYVDMLSKQFNSDLIAEENQLSLFEVSFSDEDRLSELVQNLLSELKGDADIVKNHVLVLFETVGYQLTHIRAVMVTPSLDIAKDCDENWSQYISGNESAVVEKIEAPASPSNQPSRGLSLKPKALNRQKSNSKIKEADKENIEKA